MANGSSERDRNSRDMESNAERYRQGSDSERREGAWQGEGSQPGTYEGSQGGYGSSHYGGSQAMQGRNYGDQRIGQGYGSAGYGAQSSYGQGGQGYGHQGGSQ